MALVPYQGIVTAVPTGGQGIMAVPSNVLGGYILNPYSAADQGIGSVEPLAIDIVGTCAAVQGYGTIVLLWPGDKFDLIPGLSNGHWVNASTSGHRFTCVYMLGQ